MKPLIYMAHKDEEFKVLNASQMKQELQSLPKGRYEVIIRKARRKATPDQFSYLYGVVYPMFLIGAWNVGYTTEDFANIEQLDAWCKTRWANKEITNRDTGEVEKVPKNKAQFTTEDEILYCNTLRTFASEYLGIYIPEPREKL